MQHCIIRALHNSPLGGHSSATATYSRLKSIFAWKHMDSLVQNCLICAQPKPDHSAYPGKLQPLPIPQSAWDTVSMDFVEGLPISGNANCILVVVDMFNKYAHFLPTSHPYTALTVAQLFMSNVYKLHDLPSVIISDRDLVFTSQFWQHLFRLAGTTLQLSSSYHPQTDGQTERVNQCMETFLRCFTSACPKKWKEWLPAAEFWYNTSLHSSLRRSPFEVLYGHKPRSLGLSITNAVPTLVADWLQECSVMQELVRQHLVRAQTRMKNQADKHRSERQFEVNDWVYLKLQSYVQASVMPHAHQKLSFKYFGPYQVTNRVDQVAYRLKLPPSSRIHPVIHVSQLKLANGYKGLDALPIPTDIPEFSIPMQVLQSRGISKGQHLVQQVSVTWSSLLDELATWDDQEALRQRFPLAPAWGQAGFPGGGNVTSSSAPHKPHEPEEVARRGGRVRRANVRITGPEWV
jgi:hypothetical protein